MRFILLFTALFSMYAYAADDRPVPEPPPTELQSSIIDPVATYEANPEMLRGALANHTLSADLICGENFKTTHELLEAFIEKGDSAAIALLRETLPQTPITSDLEAQALGKYVNGQGEIRRLACYQLLLEWRAKSAPQEKTPESDKGSSYCAVL